MTACRPVFLSLLFIAVSIHPVRAAAQQPTRTELLQFESARNAAAQAGPAIWPGFRPDTIPLQLVLPGRGTLLLGWSGAVPAGYSALGASPGVLWMEQAARGAASTAVSLADRMVAQVVVSDTARAPLAGLIAHEAFHAFARSIARTGVKFGRGENSYYVSQYPVFDVTNETQFALEVAVLRDALRAPTQTEARVSARRYLAVRETRQRRMDPNVALFEAMTELNEGIAEYAFVRAAASAGGETAVHAASDQLGTLLAESSLSVRLRFYVTGIGQALLLDQIGPADWKQQLMERDITLQDLIDEAVGDRIAYVAEAERLHAADDLASSARTRVDVLRATVRARADSLMRRPGVKLVLDGAQTGIASCAFDPQNLLQLGDGALLHTRWLKVCRHGVDLEFNAPVVQENNELRAVIGDDAQIVLTVGGNPFALTATPTEVRDIRLESPGVTGTIARARVSRSAGVVTVAVIEP